MVDAINPTHYQSGGLQVIDLIDGFSLSYTDGNVVKYLLRAGRKTLDPTEDVRKAIWYLKRRPDDDGYKVDTRLLERYFRAFPVPIEIENAILNMLSGARTSAVSGLQRYLDTHHGDNHAESA